MRRDAAGASGQVAQNHAKVYNEKTGRRRLNDKSNIMGNPENTDTKARSSTQRQSAKPKVVSKRKPQGVKRQMKALDSAELVGNRRRKIDPEEAVREEVTLFLSNQRVKVLTVLPCRQMRLLLPLQRRESRLSLPSKKQRSLKSLRA